MQQVEELAKEIEFQLKEDILYFAWMVQIARTQNPGGTEADWANAVGDAIILLQSTNEIVVGTAKQVNGRVEIEGWPEKGKDLRERMNRCRESAAGRDRDFCFWVGRR